MRLTNFIRNTFVLAVERDTPEVVFPKGAVIQQTLLEKMNPKLRAVWEDESTRKFLNKGYCEFASDFDHSSRYVFYGNLYDRDVLGDMIDAKKARDNAISKVRKAANACTTLKQLQEMLPELVSYMPSETGPALKAVPMVIGVVEDLKKAGFPK